MNDGRLRLHSAPARDCAFQGKSAIRVRPAARRSVWPQGQAPVHKLTDPIEEGRARVIIESDRLPVRVKSHHELAAIPYPVFEALNLSIRILSLSTKQKRMVAVSTIVIVEPRRHANCLFDLLQSHPQP